MEGHSLPLPWRWRRRSSTGMTLLFGCILRLSSSIWNRIFFSYAVILPNPKAHDKERLSSPNIRFRNSVEDANNVVRLDRRRLVSKPSPVSYTGVMEAECRLKDGSEGQGGSHYDEVADLTLNECAKGCTSNGGCKGYEFIHREDNATPICRFWKEYAPQIEPSANNFCFWKHEDCCDPNPAHSCSSDYQPVACGINRCTYDNLCFANAAGWNDSECVDRCPDKYVPQGECSDNELGAEEKSSHTFFFQPVSCQTTNGTSKLLCEYESFCVAEKSGVDNTMLSCQLTCPPEIPTAGCAPSCSREYDPHICGKAKCEYSNYCTATEGAGFKIEQCYRKFPIDESDEGQE